MADTKIVQQRCLSSWIWRGFAGHLKRLISEELKCTDTPTTGNDLDKVDQEDYNVFNR